MPTQTVETHQVRSGDRFSHARQLDLAWRPHPGQKYSDVPSRVMVVTRVVAGEVYYRPADVAKHGDQASWVAPIEHMGVGGDIVGEWL